MGVLLAGGAAGLWMSLWTTGGPITFHDTSGYLALADALRHGGAVVTDRPDRTPGYPIFLLACRALAWVANRDASSVATVVQTLLLSGLGTWMMFDIGQRLGGPLMAVVAALLYAGDADLQVFGRYVMSESQATVLLVAMTWFAVRDGGWRRARWAAAALALTRPHLACLAAFFGVLEVIRGRVRAAARLVWPTIAGLGVWVLFAQLAGGQPIEASRRIQALCQFGTAYEAELWRALPAGALRTTLEQAHDSRLRAYGAARLLNGDRPAWNPGADWRPVAEAASAMIRSDPLGYLRARLRLVPAAYGASAGTWPILARVEVPEGAGASSRWARLAHSYQVVFYGSFGLFAVLAGIAFWNGWGVATAIAAMRTVVLPSLLAVLVSTAFLSLSDYEIGRVGLVAHPLVALVWALSVTGVTSFVGRRRRRE